MTHTTSFPSALPSPNSHNDPTQWSGGYVTPRQLATHGFGISRGLFILATLASEVCHRNKVQQYFTEIMSYAENAAGVTEPSMAMTVAMRDVIRELVVLAHLFHVDLHAEVDAAVASEREDLGLPTPSRSAL